uniref:Uncharacterized protein n=1 Tax=Anguilla anguilla TaxID=7936 RepID=A0A0E9Q7Q8_ANGAN
MQVTLVHSIPFSYTFNITYIFFTLVL